MSAAAASSPTADREIVITRLLDAPRELVFEAWTHAEHVAQWWGPLGFTSTVREMEVREGGVWRLDMLGPDGTVYPNRIIYREVKRPARLVYDHDSDVDDDPHRFHVTVTFDDVDGKTRLTMRLLFATAAARDYVVREHGAIEGGNQTLQRLEAYLQRMAR